MLFIGLLFTLGGLLLFILGLVALIRGKLSLTKGSQLTGRQARWAGVGLMVLGFVLQVVWQIIITAQ